MGICIKAFDYLKEQCETISTEDNNSENTINTINTINTEEDHTNQDFNEHCIIKNLNHYNLPSPRLEEEAFYTILNDGRIGLRNFNKFIVFNKKFTKIQIEIEFSGYLNDIYKLRNGLLVIYCSNDLKIYIIKITSDTKYKIIQSIEVKGIDINERIPIIFKESYEGELIIGIMYRKEKCYKIYFYQFIKSKCKYELKNIYFLRPINDFLSFLYPLKEQIILEYRIVTLESSECFFIFIKSKNCKFINKSKIGHRVEAIVEYVEI
jgi:hypothetical protein